MENFFGVLKCEMFYGQESKYRNIRDLMNAIDDYIHYYNEQRIKVKLKGQTPSQFRSLSF
ncbi:MAG: IS3 family transposase [Oscillospiraceae bacterium]|nr:IS3 family transposase [Oscillospiraceae bacterium]